MKELDIGQVAMRSGLTAATLRFYEQQGLIQSAGRQGIRRVFRADIMQRLALISLAKAAGFTLAEIGEMFAPDGQLLIDRQQLVTKSDLLDRQIGRLTAMRDGLRHAARCPADNHMQCPVFLRLLADSAEGKLSRRRRRALPE